MARNEEKAISALNRWTAQKRDLETPYAHAKRPKIASEVKTIRECDHWRSQLIRGVSKKIGEIQNAALGEHRIRDLNDDINKELRELKYWEEQIKALGGQDYGAQKQKAVDAYGAELAGQSGYKYFGAARDLPGVRELFEKEEPPETPRKSRKQLFRNIQPDYYGWGDEEDGMLLLIEQKTEHELVQKEIARWEAEHKTRAEDAGEANRAFNKAHRKKDEEKNHANNEKGLDNDVIMNFRSFVDVPTMEEVEGLILEKKKQTLLARYVSKEGRKEQESTNELLKPSLQVL